MNRIIARFKIGKDKFILFDRRRRKFFCRSFFNTF
jgi:hypothetical protein